jgi:single-strand DNA-binding protein
MSGDTTVTVIGNICNEPDLKFLPNGTAVVNTTVASTPRIRDKQSGEFKDGDPLFLRLNIWREMAENAAESLTKGARVIVSGRLKQRSYDDPKSGEKKTSFEIEVDEIGPSLRYAQAKVSKVSKSSKASPAADPWGSNDVAPF